MKNWWLNLSLREKQAASLGAILLGIFIIYEILFAPLITKNEKLRQKIRSNQTLLLWMQDTNTKIQSLTKNKTKLSHKNSASLLSALQNAINNSKIAKNVSQLQQSEEDSVQLHLQKVSFDELITWLTLTCQENKLLIVEMAATFSGEPGLVNVDIKLKNVT
jgi:general secretion pathway protein M